MRTRTGIYLGILKGRYRPFALAGRIGAESSAVGVSIPFDDLLIGACALEEGTA